jgi:selT/selW/selH-like putative selenoprotein
LTTKLLNAFKTKITELKLIPDKGGCFELSLNGTLAYSKLSTGKFPDEKEMVSFVEKQFG